MKPKGAFTNSVCSLGWIGGKQNAYLCLHRVRGYFWKCLHKQKKIASFSQSKSKSKFPKGTFVRSAMSYKLHFCMGKEKRFQIMSETVVLVRKFGIGNSWNHGLSSSYDLSFHKLKSGLRTFSVQTIDWPVFDCWIRWTRYIWWMTDSTNFVFYQEINAEKKLTQ